MALTDLYTLAIDATFKQKVRMAMMSAALAIIGEDSTTGKTLEKRQALGVSVLADGGATKLDAFSYAAAGYGTLTGTSTDSDIQFVVNSIWNDLAGITT